MAAEVQGLRAALKWAETQPTEILDSTQVPWDHAEAAATKLQDFLLQILDEHALLLVIKPGLAERGWESWRLLVQQYAPSGGPYELGSMMASMTIHQCKSFNELPSPVASEVRARRGRLR